MKKMLCIDGNSILNRQFFGIRFLSTKEGFPTNAIFGFVNVLSKQLEALEPDYIAVAFDLKAPTFRHKMYADYKAGRRPAPEDLIKQFPAMKELLRAMGIAVLELEGYEADDILGTLSKMAEEASEDTEAYVLTGDRDSLQLISKKTRVLLATNTDTVVFDEAAFLEKYGVRADQYVDVKALMGDSSDNIPGVPGIGEKTAFKLISDASSLDGIYENIENMGLTNSVKNKLEAGKESAYTSKVLATICREVPLGLTLDDIAYKGMNRAQTRALLLSYEFMGAIKKLGLDKEETAEPTVATESAPVQIREIESSEFANLNGEFFAFDFDGESALISDGKIVYKIESPDSSLTDFLNNKKIICLDCKEIYQKLENYGIRWRSCYFDVMLGAYVDDSNQNNYSIERLVTTYLGEMISEDTPSVAYIARMWRGIESRLEEMGQKNVLYDIEMPLAAVLCDMEIEGCRVD